MRIVVTLLQPGGLYPYSKDLTAMSQLVSPVTLSGFPQNIRSTFLKD